MREKEIRLALRQRLSDTFGDDQDTLILDELGICQGAVRIDIAVVNGALHGYEIKSEHDTLYRLPTQEASYSKVFDKVTIVIGKSFLSSIRKSIPSWWGIMVAMQDVHGTPQLITKREPRMNTAVDAFALAQLLWREEALELLKEHGLDHGLRTKSRKLLWQALANNISLSDLRTNVREKLVKRKGWRVGISPERDGAMSQPFSK